MCYSRRTVLVVDEADEFRYLQVRLLESVGYRVIAASDAEEAILMCQGLNEPIDLLITDLVVNNVSGNDLVYQLRRLYPDLKVLIVSGHSESSISLLMPDYPFLQKPFHIFDLAMMVRNVLDTPVIAEAVC
jgi:two-component system cell cycle sensor histidine kinase/response regulator CckA